MSISRICTCFTALLVLIALAASAEAQRDLQNIPPWVDADGNNPDVVQPFIHPLAFDEDWQYFAPADIEEFGGGPPARTGWFATYDRSYLWMTRPENEVARDATGTVLILLPDQTGGDFGSGNRFELGYMTDEDHGWFLSTMHFQGPNYYDKLTVERIDVYDAADEINGDPSNSVDLRGGGAGTGMGPNPRRPGFPPRDANDPVTGARDYRLFNSVNVADISSFELNKTFRLKKLHYGSRLEPFFGFRYIKFQDFFQRDFYERYDPTGNPLGLSIPSTAALGPITNFTIEEVRRNHIRIDNHMVGGQLGFRWYKKKARWLLSSEVRAFAFQNFQELDAETNVERTYYQTVAVDAQIDTVSKDRFTDSAHAEDFVFGGEVRAEAAFELTRDIALRAGVNFFEFGRGVARGGSLLFDQDVTMIGGQFGFTVNR